MQGSFQLYTEVFDVDVFDDSRVDDIYAERSLSPSSSFTGVQSFTGDHGSRIRLSFRVQCTANFFGSNCAILCVARDDSGGHFTCGNSGERICLSGWSDPGGNCLTRKELLYMQYIFIYSNAYSLFCMRENVLLICIFVNRNVNCGT